VSLLHSSWVFVEQTGHRTYVDLYGGGSQWQVKLRLPGGDYDLLGVGIGQVANGEVAVLFTAQDPAPGAYPFFTTIQVEKHTVDDFLTWLRFNTQSASTVHRKLVVYSSSLFLPSHAEAKQMGLVPTVTKTVATLDDPMAGPWAPPGLRDSHPANKKPQANCPECWGTGYYRGCGAPCSKGCKAS
jgi:hypothetical protein